MLSINKKVFIGCKVQKTLYFFSPPDFSKWTEEQMFKVYDKNGDGVITCDEMKSLMLAFGENLSDSEIDGFIRAADMDGDGKVTLQEFKLDHKRWKMTKHPN